MPQQWKQQKGMTIVYWGDGKGKTTATMGVAVRALGWGWPVYIAQFMKSAAWPSGERTLFGSLSSKKARSAPCDLPLLAGEGRGRGLERVGKRSVGTVTFDVLGEGFVGIMGDKKTRETHQHAAAAALTTARTALISGKYRLVILDEILSAVDEVLLSEEQILECIAVRPEDTTLVMTGHASYPRIAEVADLVTEMRKIKHPFDDGHIALKGIDY